MEGELGHSFDRLIGGVIGDIQHDNIAIQLSFMLPAFPF